MRGDYFCVGRKSAKTRESNDRMLRYNIVYSIVLMRRHFNSFWMILHFFLVYLLVDKKNNELLKLLDLQDSSHFHKTFFEAQYSSQCPLRQHLIIVLESVYLFLDLIRLEKFVLSSSSFFKIRYLISLVISCIHQQGDD